MDWTEIVSLAASVGTIVAAIAVCITIAFVWRQTSLQSEAHKNELRRFRRESLLFVFDFLHRDEFRSARNSMLSLLNSGNDTPTDALGKQHFRQVLNTYEMLSQSVLQDGIDEQVWRGYWKSTLQRDWQRLKKFVEQERREANNDRLFCDAETVYRAWAADKLVKDSQ